MSEPAAPGTPAPTPATAPAAPSARAERLLSVPFILMLFTNITFTITLVALFFLSIPKDNESTVQLLVGALLAAFTTINGYYFGSNASSKTKDDTINSLSK